MQKDVLVETIMTEQALDRTIKRMAHEIVEQHEGKYNLVIIGLKTRGEFLANRLCQEISLIDSNISFEKGVLDVTLYRDDFRTNIKVPDISVNDLPFSIDDKKVILVDDVIYTGRSVNAALNAIMDLGRPKKIQFAALIDRGLRELPIRPDYIGCPVKTFSSQAIKVKLKEIDKEDGVDLIKIKKSDI